MYLTKYYYYLLTFLLLRIKAKGQITFLTSQSQKNEIQSSSKLQPTPSLTADKDKLGQFPLASHWTPYVT
jgi:hypothetical protein